MTGTGHLLPRLFNKNPRRQENEKRILTKIVANQHKNNVKVLFMLFFFVQRFHI